MKFAERVEARGQKIAILAAGTLLYPALQAAENIDATVVNMRWAKPLDAALLLGGGPPRCLGDCRRRLPQGGAGSAVLEALAQAGVVKPVCNWVCRSNLNISGQIIGFARFGCPRHRKPYSPAVYGAVMPRFLLQWGAEYLKDFPNCYGGHSILCGLLGAIGTSFDLKAVVAVEYCTTP